MKKISSYNTFVNDGLQSSNLFRSLGTFLGVILCIALSPLYVVFVAIRFVVLSFVYDFYDFDDYEDKGGGVD